MPGIPYVILDLDKPRKFRLSLRAMLRITQALKIDMEQLSNVFARMNQIDIMEIIIWAGCAGEDPALTREYVGEELIGMGNIEELAKAITPHLDYINSRSAASKNAAAAEKKTTPGGIGTPPPGTLSTQD